jgi:hypothetical protein
MSIQMEMHREHVARTARLMYGDPPPPKPKRPRPVSPFMREVQRNRAMAWEAMMYLRSHPVPAQWVYAPPVVYDHCDSTGVFKRSCRTIATEVAIQHGFTLADLKSPRRNRKVVRARHEAFWRCFKETEQSLPAIGRALGGKDHTTVLHGIRAHEKRMKEALDA